VKKFEIGKRENKTNSWTDILQLNCWGRLSDSAQENALCFQPPNSVAQNALGSSQTWHYFLWTPISIKMFNSFFSWLKNLLSLQLDLTWFRTYIYWSMFIFQEVPFLFKSFSFQKYFFPRNKCFRWAEEKIVGFFMRNFLVWSIKKDKNMPLMSNVPPPPSLKIIFPPEVRFVRYKRNF